MKNSNKISIFRFICQLLYLTLFIVGLLSNKFVFLFINLTAVLLGPIFCGWMCFVGFYQDLLRYIGAFIKKEPIEINEKVHNILKYLRYVILVGTLAFGGIFLLPAEVRHNFSMLIKGNISIDLAFYLLIILGVSSLFTRRIFCRCFCTFGARLGLYSLLRPITIKRNEGCISCKSCTNACLMNIQVHKINNLADPACNNCLKCIECCPKNSLSMGFRNYLKPFSILKPPGE